VLVRAGAAAEQEGGGGAAAAPRGSTALLLLQTQVGSAPEGPNARAVGRRAPAHCSSARQRRRSADGPASLPQAILYERHRAALARHRYPLYPALAAILDGGAMPGAAQAGPANPHAVIAVVARTMALSAAADRCRRPRPTRFMRPMRPHTPRPQELPLRI
jgi:hypothetical protein